MPEVQQFSFDEAPVVGAFASYADVPPAPLETSPERARFWALKASGGRGAAINADDKRASRALVYRIQPEAVPDPERAPAVQQPVATSPVRVVRAGRAAERVKMARALNEAAGRPIITEGPA